MLGVFERFDHIVSLIELLPQVHDDATLVFFQVCSVLLKIIHDTLQSLVLINGARCFPLASLRKLSLPLEVFIEYTKLLFLVAVFTIQSHMVISDLLVVTSELV